jgi:aryl-alcohol dehydrogenase-like predicted oxidoreductase
MMRTTRLGEYEISPLMLGTVQFGLPYGVANRSGQPSFDDVCAILQCAFDGGVNCLDTAPFYGDSEEVLGRALQTLNLADKMFIATKSLRTVSPDSNPQAVLAVAREEVESSLQRLRLKSLPLCLIHVQENFRFVDALLALKAEGLIHHVGCSAVDPQATLAILRTGQCEAVQIPTSILDRRFIEARVFEEAQARDVAVFARSTYLQGLVLMEPSEVPDDLQAVVPALKQLRAVAAEAAMNIEELALRYVLGIGGLSCAVVGVESLAQMRSNLAIFERGPLESTLHEKIAALQFGLPDLIFEPWRWQKRMPDAKPVRA